MSLKPRIRQRTAQMQSLKAQIQQRGPIGPRCVMRLRRDYCGVEEEGAGTGVARSGLTVGATVLGVSLGCFGFSCMRSLTSPFLRLWLVFFLVTVSPLRPSGWARTFS